MRVGQILPAFIGFLFISSLLQVHPVAAETTSTSEGEATITCTFQTGSQLNVHTQMIVERIENIYETTYTRQMIESTTDSDVLAVIKNQVHILMKNQMEETFASADVTAITKKPAYEKPYFIDTFQVNLTTAFFQYNGSMDLGAFLNGVLDMGATITYRFPLSATNGWNITYTYVLPTVFDLAYANTDETSPDNTQVSWMIHNRNGAADRTDAVVSLFASEPTTTPSESEDISLEFEFDTRSIHQTSLTDAIVVNRMNINQYAVLPEFVTGVGSIPADGVRLFIESGLLTWGDVFERTIQPIEASTTPVIENSSFNQTLDFLFSWDAESTTNCSTPYNITHMDDEPPLRAEFIDPEVALRICGMSARAFFGLMNAGASSSISSDDVNFGSRLTGLPYSYLLRLYLPTNISLNGQNVYVWNATTPIGGAFSSTLQPQPAYTDEHVETYIEIDFMKMDLNIPSLFTGKTELTTSTKLKEDDRLYVIHRSSELPFSHKINLSYLNADAFRLCVEENVFDESHVSSFLSKKTEEFQQSVSMMLPGLSVKGMNDNKVFSNSLVWDEDIASMDAVNPIVVSNIANEVYAVHFNVSLWPAALSIAPQQFTLQGIENQLVTYRILFPRGLAISASDSAGSTIITGASTDGREYVEVTFNEQSANQTTVLTCVLTASPVYVLSIFLPCILVFILLIVLVVIILLIRKKRGGLRRGKGKLFEPEDNEPSEYSDSDYYVPPPPPSTKKKK